MPRLDRESHCMTTMTILSAALTLFPPGIFGEKSK